MKHSFDLIKSGSMKEVLMAIDLKHRSEVLSKLGAAVRTVEANQIRQPDKMAVQQFFYGDIETDGLLLFAVKAYNQNDPLVYEIYKDSKHGN